MTTKRKNVDSADLLSITNSFQEKLKEIEKKLCGDLMINQGLFVMITAYFEDSIRELMRIVLVAYPEKLTDNSYTISREQICAVADKGYSVIIDYELYAVFKNGISSQLETLLKMLFNKEPRNERKNNNRNTINEEQIESIKKLTEISLYRNALIHNGGKISVDINERVKVFKPQKGEELIFDTELVKSFIDEYIKFYQYLTSEINNTFTSYQNLSLIGKIETLWKDCFSSPILQFKDYWEIDNERDLIIGIKYPEIENCISSSEKVLLSIWRHQFDDTIKTEEFLLCSVNHHKIYELYKGLDDLKFYHIKQKSKINRREKDISASDTIFL